MAVIDFMSLLERAESRHAKLEDPLQTMEVY